MAAAAVFSGAAVSGKVVGEWAYDGVGGLQVASGGAGGARVLAGGAGIPTELAMWFPRAQVAEVAIQVAPFVREKGVQPARANRVRNRAVQAAPSIAEASTHIAKVYIFIYIYIYININN